MLKFHSIRFVVLRITSPQQTEATEFEHKLVSLLVSHVYNVFVCHILESCVCAAAQSIVNGKLCCKTSSLSLIDSSSPSSSLSTSSVRLSVDGRRVAVTVRQLSAVLDTDSASLLSSRNHDDRRALAGHVTQRQLFVAGALDGDWSDGTDVTRPFVLVLVDGHSTDDIARHC